MKKFGTVKTLVIEKYKLESEKMMLDNPDKYDTIQEALDEIKNQKVVCPDCEREVSITETYGSACVDCWERIYLIA